MFETDRNRIKQLDAWRNMEWKARYDWMVDQ